MDLCNFANAHVNDAVVPTLNHLPEPYLKGKRLLAFILGGPELFTEIFVFACFSGEKKRSEKWRMRATIAAG